MESTNSDQKKRRSKSPPKSTRRPKRRKETPAAAEETSEPGLPLLAPDPKWDAMYAQLLEFKQQHGDCRVSQKDEAKLRLGKWVSMQRYNYRRYLLRPDHLQRLEQIDFAFALDRDRQPIKVDGGSNPKYNTTPAAAAATGTTTLVHAKDVSKNDTHGNTVKCNSDSTAKASNTVSEDVLEPDPVWDKMFTQLLAYRKKFGNCHVPQHNDAYTKLGNWVSTQRKRYRQFQSRPDHLERLQHINFSFALDSNRQPMKVDGGVDPMYKQFVAAKALPTIVDVPDAKQDDEFSEDESEIDDNQNEAAESNWDTMLRRLVSYNEEHGDMLFPPNYKQDQELADWVENQRMLYIKHQLSAEQVTTLESNGFVWSVPSRGKRRDDTPTRSDDATQYANGLADNVRPARQAAVMMSERIRANTNRTVPSDDLDLTKTGIGDCESGDNLPATLQVRPGPAEYNEMIAKIKARLPLPDKTSKELETLFLGRLRRLTRYVQMNGHANVPYHYDDKDLGKWVSQQRTRLRSQSINQVQFQSLVDLGFVWNMSSTRVPLPLQLNFVKGTLPAFIKNCKMVDDTEDHDWDHMMARLISYKEMNGDMLLSPVSNHDQELADWAMQQRALYKEQQLSADHIAALESTGFVWSFSSGGVRPAKRERREVDRFATYVQPARQAAVMASERIRPASVTMGAATKLGQTNIGTGGMTDKYNKMIAKIKVCLPEPLDPDTMTENQLKDHHYNAKMLSRLKNYIKEYGDSMTPQYYAPDVVLGQWVSNQRKRLRARTLHQDEFQALVDIGFVWCLNRVRQPTPMKLDFVKGTLPAFNKETWPSEAKAFNKTAATKRSSSLKSTAIHSASSKTVNSQKVLDTITTLLRPPRDSSTHCESDRLFQEMYQRLIVYKREHGNTIVPRSYEDKELGSWVSSARKRLTEKTLYQDQFEMLNRIGFAWSLEPSRKEQPLRLEDLRGGKLDDSPERELRIDQPRPPVIGFENRKEFYARIRTYLPPPLHPSDMTDAQLASEAHFKRMVKRLKAYVKAHGNAKVPLSYSKDPDLGQFINTQRKRLKTRVTRQDQFDILNSCGFVWQMNKYQQEIPVTLDFLPDAEMSGMEAHTGAKGPSDANSVEGDTSKLTSRLLATVPATDHTETSSVDAGFSVESTKGNMRSEEVSRKNALPAFHTALENGAATLTKINPVDAAGTAMTGTKSLPHATAALTVEDQIRVLSENASVITCYTRPVASSMKEALPIERVAAKDGSADTFGGAYVAPATSDGGSKRVPSVAVSPAIDRNMRRRTASRDFAVPSMIQTQFPSRTLFGADHDNLDTMMSVLARNPLVDEFARKPFRQQHRELAAQHDQIVQDPIDMDIVFGRIKDRAYDDCRAVLDDLCRVFDQRLQVFSHSQAADAHMHVSIMSHLKTFVLMLWQEYMLPSDSPDDDSDPTYPLFVERDFNRNRQMRDSGLLPLNKYIVDHVCDRLSKYIATGGWLDGMDSEQLSSIGSTGDLEAKLKGLVTKLSKLSELAQKDMVNYQLSTLHGDLLRCVPASSPNQVLIESRITRFFWQMGTRIHEANIRGTDASVVWGDSANILWARDGPRKPYWPALCLGMLESSDTAEPWEPLLTERNERRLSSNIATKLAPARRACDAAIRRDGGGCFVLVEFLGIHEFRWISDVHIYEFDRDEDPNDDLPRRYTDPRQEEIMPRALEEVNLAATQYATSLTTIF